MEGLESAYQRHEKKEKSMCKHCKSEAHSTLEHRKHYKNFREEKKDERMRKHMKMFEPERSEESEKPVKKHMKSWTREEDEAQDRKEGVKQGSKEDLAKDNARGLGWTHKKDMGVGGGEKGDDLKKKGLPKTYRGKSTKLGHGGRAAKLHDELPGKMPESEKGAIIGKIARSKGAAPGGPNYHGKHRKGYSEADMGDMSHGKPPSGPAKGNFDNSHAVGGSPVLGNVNGGNMAKRMKSKKAR